MATSSQLGFPAVEPPRELVLREVQQTVSNIRERFRRVDAAIGTLQQSATAAAATATDTAALRKQLVNLQAELDALEAVVAGLTSSTGGDTDPRTEQLAGELIEIRNALDNPPSDPRVEQLAGEFMGLQAEVDALAAPDTDAVRLPAVEAQVAQMQQQVDAIDTVGQTAAHAALLQGLQDKIDDINRGVLV